MSGCGFESICVHHILDGLRVGLSHFAGLSRAAVIYAVRPDDPPRIYDPQNLLRGHEPRLAEVYLDSQDWRGNPPDGPLVDYIEPAAAHDLSLAGRIGFGGRAKALAYQMWFTEQHPDLCSTGPVQHWLEYAVRLFAQNCDEQNVLNLDAAEYLLQSLARHAVRDFLVDERSLLLGLDTGLRIYPLLDCVLGVSRTSEEGAWPRGSIVFVEPAFLSHLDFLLRFPELERPALNNYKHVRKTLQAVESGGRFLASDGRTIVGVAQGQRPPASVVARFRGGHGFLLLDDELVCSFADGGFQASNRQPVLVHLEEALLEAELSAENRHELFSAVTRIVNAARDNRHGCGLVVDLGKEPVDLPGQKMEEPLDLRREGALSLAISLSRVDGALHLTGDMQVKSFACLLDGLAVPGENRARGARFNSAMRFTAQHPGVVVVVVSADRPVSVIQGGVELTAQCEWVSMPGLPQPPTLQQWVDEAVV